MPLEVTRRMASIQCPGCKAHISVPGLIDCPRCKTFLNPPFLRKHAADEEAANRVSTALLGPKEWFGLLAIAALAVIAALMVYRLAVPSESQKVDRKVSAALLACQQRIAGTAGYGNAEMPPYSKNWANGDEFHFAWQRGSFHFTNGFGASVPMSASCTGILSTGEIQHLTINSKDVI